MISDDTILMPELIAESVVDELGCYLHYQHKVEIDRPALVSKLTAMAETHYEANPKFQHKVKKNETWGRDWHYTFMRHWLSAELLPLYQDHKIPQSFANGESLQSAVTVLIRAAK